MSAIFRRINPFSVHFANTRSSLLTSLSSGLRLFSVDLPRKWHTTELAEQDFSSLKVNQQRLMDDIHNSCKWGRGEKWGSDPTETGMRRLALSDADREVREWFVDTTKSLGCQITVDAMGNTFAVRSGRRKGPPTYAGSHLDTQPSGGRYDGILGVLAGVEMLRVLNDNWLETEYPVGVVNWTNEEGARFPISMVSSAVWADDISLERAHNLQEVGGGTATMKSELQRIGYLGSTAASFKSMPMAAHFELHIEQGPILEREKRKIGVVQGVQAYRWFSVDISGRDAHTGTTPFSARADAILAASKMILYSHRAASQRGCLASTGILTLKPGSVNTIPGSVSFSLDLRSSSDDIVQELEDDLRSTFASLAAGEEDTSGINKGCEKGLPVDVKWRTDFVNPATIFHEDCIGCVMASAENMFGSEVNKLTMAMTSGAGHDSVYTSKHFPSSMIFIPCRDGVSHNPAEYSTPEDCALGAQVLTQSIIRYDRLRADRA